jgi:VWFA-related protein
MSCPVERFRRGVCGLASVALASITVANGSGLASGAGTADEVAIREDVAVRLVQVETLVLDSADRTVPGLSREDFTLLVDHRPVKIDVLDTTCDTRALTDPRPGERADARLDDVRVAPRQFALVLDWIHAAPGERGSMLSVAREIVAHRKADRDRILLAVLADGLHVVHPLTSNRAALLAALDTLIKDPRTSTMPTLSGVTERPFHRSLGLLLEVLTRYDGAKAVVLFSPWTAPSDEDDGWFLEVARRAAEARAAIYPIDAFGLSTDDRRFRGSGALARLANESGGRYSSRTNDLTLAFARAERDLSCRYTLGFYINEDARARNRTIAVRMNRPGLIARHPERFRGRPADERERDRNDALFVDPGAAVDPDLSLRVTLLRPSSTRAWRTRVDIDPPPGDPGAAERTASRRLRVRVERIGLVHDLVDAVLPLDPGSRRSEVLDLTPGRWTVTAMLDPVGPGGEASIGRRVVDVPRVRFGTPFVSGVLVEPDGAVRAHVCLVDVWPDRTTFLVERAVLDANGAVRFSLPSMEVDLGGWRAVRCRRLDASLPLGDLPPGEYRYRLTVDGAATTAPFRVEP